MKEIKMKVHPTRQKETFLEIGYEGAFPIYYSHSRDKFYWQYIRDGRTVHLREVHNPGLKEKYRLMMRSSHGQTLHPENKK